MKGKKFFNLKNVIAVLVMVAIVAGFYYYTAQKSDMSDTSQEEYDILINKDLEYAYPATPSEVVKLYARMAKCMYSSKLSDKMLKEMTNQQRKLFDDELLESNPLESQLEKLKEDIQTYQDENKSIINYTVEGNDEVSYTAKSQKEYATLSAAFMIKTEDKYEKTYEKFTLHKDGKNWKIVGWTLNENNTTKK